MSNDLQQLPKTILSQTIIRDKKWITHRIKELEHFVRVEEDFRKFFRGKELTLYEKEDRIELASLLEELKQHDNITDEKIYGVTGLISKKNSTGDGADSGVCHCGFCRWAATSNLKPTSLAESIKP